MSNDPRRKMRWLNFALMSVLVGGIALMANVLSASMFKRVDFTRSKQFELSDFTEKVLKELDTEVTLYIMPNSPSHRDERLPRVLTRLRNLINEYDQRTPLLHVVPVANDNAEKMGLLEKTFDAVQRYDAIYVVAGKDERIRKDVIQLRSLYNAGDVGGSLIKFTAEEVITKSIRKVTLKETRVAYYVTGHQEPKIDDSSQLGLVFLTGELQDREGIELKNVSLIDEPHVPPDCDLLVILGPKTLYHEREISKVHEYLERGGNLFYAPLEGRISGLEQMLEAWGVKMGRHAVLDPANPYSPTSVLIRTFPPAPWNEINLGMQGTMFTMPNTVVVEEPIRRDDRITSSRQMIASQKAWEELQPLDAKIGGRKPDPSERVGNLPVGLAVKAHVDQPADKNKDFARIIAWGSCFALANFNLVPSPPNTTYVINNFRWLVGGGDLGPVIPTVRDEQKPYAPEEGTRDLIFWIVVVGFPAIGLILAVLVVITRRK